MTEMLKNLLLPSHLAALLIAVGAITQVFPAVRSRGKSLFALGAAVFVIFSTGLVATLLIRPLEYRYPAVIHPENFTDVGAVVVLTAYAVDDPSLSVNSRASSPVAFRVLEAARLFRESSATIVVVSGESLAATVVTEMLVDIGVPESSIVVDGGATHTSDSAARLVEQLAGQQFFLVSSAGHLPRAMGVFRKQGLAPIAAPTDYQLSRRVGPGSLAISPLHLQASDLAINEYAGLLFYRAVGRTETFW